MAIKHIFFISIFSMIFVTYSRAQSLDEHLWKNRIVLLFTPDFQNVKFKNQLKILKKETKGLLERKLVIYQISPNAIKRDDSFLKNKNWISKTYQQFKINNNAFTFILIGLDGGEKLRSTSIVKPSKLFGKIDRMPMRRAEMRNRKRN